MILPRLREATGEHHRAVEALVPLASGHGPDEYLRHLAVLLGFLRPMERELAPALPWFFLGLPFADRAKSPLLASDLRALGADPDRIADCARIPQIRSTAFALGCAYVIEGSTLGGKVIERQLAREEAWFATAPRSFLGCYGDEVGPRWKAFCARLECLCAEDCAGDEAVAGAVATFESLRRWLEAEAVGARSHGM